MTRSMQTRSFLTLFSWAFVATVVILLTAAAGAAATSCTWQAGQPFKMHWPQMPDLSAAGMDVSFAKATLADDFKCTAGGAITGIHIWASFANDVLPKGGAGAPTFVVSIMADVPADGRRPSQPGQTLWTRTFKAGEYTFQEVNDGPEDLYEPVTDAYLAVNHRKAYQYNFCIADSPFVQQEGTVYWLTISVAPNANYDIGWKTTAPRYRWNDIAACAPAAGAWSPMDYPKGHVYAEQPIGLSFVINGDDAAVAPRDFGDAPDSSNSLGGARMTAYPDVVAHFPTAFEANLPPYGPMHLFPREAFYLGKWVSVESQADMGYDQDGVTNIDPLADVANRDGGDDGLQLPVVMPPCQKTTLAYTITVTSGAVRQAYVNVWCDWNRDGDWDDVLTCPDGTQAPEWAVQNQMLELPGIGMFSAVTPSFTCWHPTTTGNLDPMWMRITISEVPWVLSPSSIAPPAGGSGPSGGYKYGETEDYLIQPLREPVPAQYDWGDAPDDARTGGYPTLSMHGGAQHVAAGPWLGSVQDQPDAETDGQPDATATGDNTHGNNDENGVNVPPLVIGENAAITVEVQGGGGVLQGWIDFNGDHTWSSDEKICDGYLPDGVHVLLLTVPQTAVAGQSFARFRLSTRGGLNPGGLASDGEVEDYAVQIIKPPADRKWCQLPDTTPRGIDIRVDDGDGAPRSAADDFQCTSSDYLTHVTLWGSWKNDVKGQIKAIRLRIQADDPAGWPGADKTNPFSKPSPSVLWEKQFTSDQLKESLYHVVYSPGECWWDPATGLFTPGGDAKIWQIDIDIDPSQAFLQSGTPDSPVIYWLAVEVQTADGQFGWKTRQWPDHFMDDAVWDMGSRLPRSWRELRFPQGHPYYDGAKNSIDLAFCLRYTAGHTSVTSLPGAATQCPAVETLCPAVSTQCPASVTACPVSSTSCPATTTQCPTVATRCPAVSTECPTVSTQCPTVSTQCPATSTQCPAVATQCPPVQTRCPMTSTACQAIQTSCPAVETQCPATSTQCPAVNTMCPASETKCPASVTKCPAVLTQCPATPSTCIRCLGTLTVSSSGGWAVADACPVVESRCATVGDYLAALTTGR